MNLYCVERRECGWCTKRGVNSTHAQAANWKAGVFKNGATVAVTANAGLFLGWSSAPAVAFANASAAATTFTMPATALTVTASFGQIV